LIADTESCVHMLKTKMSLKIQIISFILSFFVVANAADITDVWIAEQHGRASEHVPVTFGHVFVAGDVPEGTSIQAVSTSGQEFLTQVDAKATHADGSLRHGVITIILPQLNADEVKRIRLVQSQKMDAAEIQLSDLLATDYNMHVILNLSTNAYQASIRDNLATKVEAFKWLEGSAATEWHVSVPLRDGSGNEHPHLTARFYIRAYKDLRNVKTSVVIENNWSFVPNPSGFDYDATIMMGDKAVYSKSSVAHTHHARWRKEFWWGDQQDHMVIYNRDYFFKTKTIPNYDRSIILAQSAFSGIRTEVEPMDNANITEYMPTTGAHDDIGPLPRWAALYLLSMDKRAYKGTLANGDAAASYQIHFRDKLTNLPITINDFPYLTLLGGQSSTYNPNTGEYEGFPEVNNGNQSYTPDDAHQPSLAFLPYIITGDYYFLEELHFWANWNIIMANPEYRNYDAGLLKWGQVRAQAWSLRTLAHAAYITPDAHPLKQYFEGLLDNNIQYYVDNTVGDPDANALGYLAEGAYIVDSPYQIRQWQDDFFTWTAGYLIDLGFTSAFPLFEWKSKFILGRMATDEFCWLLASGYTMQVAGSNGAPFSSFAQLFQQNYGSKQCQGSVMDGYPEEATGFGANMQPALARIVDFGLSRSDIAWNRYMARNPKQDYSSSPQFAIVPRDGTFGDVLSPPFITPPGGTFEGPVKVTLSSSDGADIFYTLDNSAPTVESTNYSQPLQMNVSGTIRAIAARTGIPVSTVVVAEFTIVADITPPTIISTIANQEPPSVYVLFSEQVTESSAENVSNYDISNDVIVLSAELNDAGDRVLLKTTEMEPDVEYQLVVNNILDRAQKPNTIAANTSVSLKVKSRVNSNLIALYTFQEESGGTITDVSGVEPAMNLDVAHQDHVTWGTGFLAITAPTILLAMAGSKINERCKQSNELTIETWVRPLSATQGGPARIASLSSDPYERNFTLGQESSAYEVRLRTNTSDANGIDNMLQTDAAAEAKLQHVIYTRSAAGTARLYIDAVEKNQRSDVSGTFTNWSSFQFALANELDQSRPWLGEFHLMALYDAALSQDDIEQNYYAGPFSQGVGTSLGDDKDGSISQFALQQNYPNPFNNVTTVMFSLKEEANVELTIYSLDGRKVATIASEPFSAGSHSRSWDGKAHSSGSYFYRMKAVSESGQRFQFIKKMLLIK
jgi:hypothetical protein